MQLTPDNETRADAVLGFTIPARHARGRTVRLDGVLDEILAAHAYPPAIAHLLAEALVLAALIGSLLKEPGSQMTMQAQTEDGIVRLLVCDYREGALRGYVDFDVVRMAELGANPSLYALFGRGYLAITFDRPGPDGRYQGIVPLEGKSLAAACEAYFAQSEQVPTLIRLAIRREHGACSAAGLLLQHLPDGEEGRERLHVREVPPEWEHVVCLAATVRHDELLDPGLSLEAIIWRLFHEEDEVRTQTAQQLARGCRCSVEHYEAVLASFSNADLADMRDDDGLVRVDCAFCSRVFPIAV